MAMTHDESFKALDKMLEAFIDGTDAMRASADSTTATLKICQWQKCDRIESSMKSFKTHSDGLSGSCTKLSLVDLTTMSSNGLQSLFDEILKISHGLIAAVMSLFSLQLSLPLFEDVHRLAKAELSQVRGLVIDIHTGRFDTCMNAIGQVWEMNAAIQKLPMTNKVAYKRSLMGVLSVVKDTHREFQEARDESVELNKKKALGEGEVKDDKHKSDDDDNHQNKIDGSGMDDDWGVMNEDEDDEEGGFSPEEMPYVNAALSLMEKSFITIKVTMDIMSLLSEQPESQESSTSTVFNIDKELLVKIQEWVATVFCLDKKFSTAVTDLGMELYAPLCLSSLKAQYDSAFSLISQVLAKILESSELFKKENDDRMPKLMNGTKDISSQLELEKACFLSI